ncbi:MULTISPECIES: excalibur calcium-binding domain-containing protein [unclassified Brevundimonas]|uniref:excalibur calcium-binding domain-containing protein n=1 Tax=unclassified Brevundimonas TaxID=2622653 RepID=UPI0032E400C9
MRDDLLAATRTNDRTQVRGLVSTDAPSARGSTPRSNGGSAYYRNCAAARAAGAAPVRRGDPGYARRLDRDGDGVGCE